MSNALHTWMRDQGTRSIDLTFLTPTNAASRREIIGTMCVNWALRVARWGRTGEYWEIPCGTRRDFPVMLHAPVVSGEVCSITVWQDSRGRGMRPMASVRLSVRKVRDYSTPPPCEGATSESVHVPDVRAYTEETARRELESAGFAAETILEVTANAAQDGRVVRQSPTSGNTAESGSDVRIFVGKVP